MGDPHSFLLCGVRIGAAGRWRVGKVTELVSRLVEPVCGELGCELVDVEYGKEGGRAVLRLLIDKQAGITLADCEAISREVEPLLDAADPVPGAYNLEVSSPGLERPLKKEADFRRFAGSTIRVRLHAPHEGRRVFQGTLKGWEDNCILLVQDGTLVAIPSGQVASARLVPVF